MSNANKTALTCSWLGAMICSFAPLGLGVLEYSRMIILGLLSFSGGLTLSLLGGLILLYSRGQVTLAKAILAIGLWLPLSLCFVFFYVAGYESEHDNALIAPLLPLSTPLLVLSILLYFLLITLIFRAVFKALGNDRQKRDIARGVTILALFIFHLFAIPALFISYHMFLAPFVSIGAMCIVANNVRRDAGEVGISHSAKNRTRNVILFIVLTLFFAVVSMLIPMIPFIRGILEEYRAGSFVVPVVIVALLPILYVVFAQEYFASKIPHSSSAQLILPALLILSSPVIANIYAMTGERAQYYGTSPSADHLLDGYMYFAYPASLIGILWVLSMTFPPGRWTRLLLIIPLPLGWLLPGMIATLMPGISALVSFIVMAPALFRWRPSPAGKEPHSSSMDSSHSRPPTES